MTSKCAAGWRVGETLFIIIQAQSPIPFYIQAQSFLHGFNIFSIFQECNYVHKSQDGLLCFVQDVTVSENHATDGSTASWAPVHHASITLGMQLPHLWSIYI